MRWIGFVVGLTALAGVASAQTPDRRWMGPAGTQGFVRGIDQPTRSSVRRAGRRYRRLPARDRHFPRVAPPSAISPGIRIIAPSRR